MSWQIQESIHFRDRDPFWTISNFYDVVARTDFSFLQHAKVEPWSSVRYQQGRHARLVHANADAVAGYARLCHFKYRITNAVSITDADLAVRKSFHGEVLAELAKSKIIAAQKALPIAVGIHLVGKYGALLPTVTGEVRLPVSINIELAHHPAPLDGKLPDCRSDSPIVPCHFGWKTDID